MTSQLQQLLETFIKFNPDEQQKCLEIAKKIHDIVKQDSQRSKEDQQPETSNSNHQEKLTMIQRTHENCEVLHQNKLFTKRSTDNTEPIQTVSPEGEDQFSPNGFMKADTNLKIKTTTKDIRCYNCTKKGHVMKNCPHSLNLEKIKNNTFSYL